MTTCFLVTCPPDGDAGVAPRAVDRARLAGDAVNRVFFQGEGVGHAADARTPVGGRWRRLAGHGLDLAVCSTAAARRNITPEKLQPGFRLAGLAQLMDALTAADTFVCCAPGGRVLEGRSAGQEAAEGVLVHLAQGPAAAHVAREAVETALMAAAFDQPVRLLLTGQAVMLLEPDHLPGVPGMSELLPLLAACYQVLEGSRRPRDRCRVITRKEADALVSSAAMCMVF